MTLSLILNSIGLGLGIIGAGLILYPALRIERDKYLLSRLSNLPPESPSLQKSQKDLENRLEEARDGWRRGDSRAYEWGATCIAFAFLLQLIAIWMCEN